MRDRERAAGGREIKMWWKKQLDEKKKIGRKSYSREREKFTRV